MADLYISNLPVPAEAVDIAAEISWIEILLSQLDPADAQYDEHKTHYEQTVEALNRRLDTPECAVETFDGTSDSMYPQRNGVPGRGPPNGAGLSASPGDRSGSSPSSYMGSNSNSGLSSPGYALEAPVAKRKRSPGVGEWDSGDSKRPSLSASPALQPGTPISSGFLEPSPHPHLGQSPLPPGTSVSPVPFHYRNQPGPSNLGQSPVFAPTHGFQVPSQTPMQQCSAPSHSSTGQFSVPYPMSMQQFALRNQLFPAQQRNFAPRAPNTMNQVPASQGNFSTSDQLPNVIDLTGDDDFTIANNIADTFPALTFPPAPQNTADPFLEVNQAYTSASGQFEQPSTSGAQGTVYFNLDDLSQFLQFGPALSRNSRPLAAIANQHLYDPPLADQHRLPQDRVSLALDFPANVPAPAQPRKPTLEQELFGDVDDAPVNPEAITKLIECIKPDKEVPPELREPTPSGMASSLMEHQKLALKWLKETEEGSHKGGLLADEMGLGKTVEAIALIVARPSTDRIYKTTLVVAPVALMRQWEKEIHYHVRDTHRLKVHVYHGPGTSADFAKLRTFDVVLTTFGTLSSEQKHIDIMEERARFQGEQESNDRRRTKNKLALLGPDCMWYRVIIDEAQCIKNRETLASKAASSLQAQHRLCMTGTPMMNSVEELYPLLRFLRIKPYNDYLRFSSDITKRVKDSHPSTRETGMKRVQALLKSIMLRRQKTTIIDGKPICEIPPKAEHRQIVPFSNDEREFYKTIESKSQARVNRYMQSGTMRANYANILVLLLRLRQACCHPNLIKDLGVQAATEGISEEALLKRASELSGEVVTRLKNFDSFECPICLDGTANPTIFLPCGHDCCGECFPKLVDPGSAIRDGDSSEKAKCPHCRNELSADNITDYKHFCRVWFPQKAQELFDETGIVSDSDSDSDSDEEEENGGEDSEDLSGFVVPDGASDDYEPKVHDSATKKERKESKKGKGKRPAYKKLTLAELKKESLRNKAAKKKYLKRLRKDYKSSSKIDRTLELVSEIRANDPTEKVLIFSQFTALLDLLEVPLDERGYKYQRYDGSMKMDDRAEAVNTFMDDPEQRIMLISLKAGNAGLNLNRASQVIILDPFWNPFVEDQAVDRAHRMPQKRVVHVHRLLVPDTVEDRIINLQEQKRELISAALDERAGQSISRLGDRELMYLFGLGARPR